MKFYFLLLLNVLGCGCDKVQLYQRGQRKGITAYAISKTPGQTECNPGWAKTTTNGNLQAYETCASKKKVPQNNECSIKSEYYVIPNADVNIVYVNVRGSGPYCKNNIIDGKVFCSTQFELRAYTGVPDGAKANSDYSIIAKVPSSSKPNPTDSRFYLYDNVYSIDMAGKSALSVLFRTTYFCGQISEVNVYYYRCPSISKELVQFPLRNAPAKEDSPSTITGHCVANSIQRTPELSMQCFHNGTSTVSGECECDRGYEVAGGQCKECTGNTFKKSVGNDEKCRSCGANTLVVQKISCKCKEDHFRVRGKEAEDEADCYKPPSPPSLKKPIRDITENSATVEFQQFSSIGRGSIILNCSRNCPSTHRIARISRTVFNVTGLGSFTQCFFKAYVANNVTRLTGHMNFLDFSFKTKAGGRPGKIKGFSFFRNGDGSITLLWEPPEVKGGQALQYLVEYGEDQNKRTQVPNTTIGSDTESVTYTFKIRAFYTVEGKEIYGDVYTSQEITIKGSGIKVWEMVIIMIVVMLVVVIISVVSFCVYKKRHPPLMERGEDGRVIQKRRLLPGAPVYVDPTIYKAVDEAVEEFAYELNRNHVTFGKLIGGGEFAEVYTGTLMKDIGKTTNVAIKTLKSGAGKKDRDDFLSEAAILGQFIDPNVIAMEGVVMKDEARNHQTIVELDSDEELGEADPTSPDVGYHFHQGVGACGTSDYLTPLPVVHGKDEFEDKNAEADGLSQGLDNSVLERSIDVTDYQMHPCGDQTLIPLNNESQAAREKQLSEQACIPLDLHKGISYEGSSSSSSTDDDDLDDKPMQRPFFPRHDKRQVQKRMSRSAGIRHVYGFKSLK